MKNFGPICDDGRSCSACIWSIAINRRQGHHTRRVATGIGGLAAGFVFSK